MKILSLFDGISIAQQALNNLGVKKYTYYASEIEPWPIAMTQHNYPATRQLGDVKNINKNNAKDIDLLIGGSPCQDLSIAKRDREGLDGKRSNLFWEYIRILKEVKPKYFVLENVASMPQAAKDVITETIGVEPIMINAGLVSAQQRKRLFWTNIKNVDLPDDENIVLKNIVHELRGEKVDEKYFVSLKIRTKKALLASIRGLEEKARTMTKAMDKGAQANGMTCVRVGKIGKGGQGERIYSLEGKSVALSAHGGGRGAKTGLYLMSSCASRTKANTVTTVQGDSMILLNDQVRRLTPIEGERLQSLPDGYTKYGFIGSDKIEISDAQRYRAIGNGFNCAVIEHILKNIINKNGRII